MYILCTRTHLSITVSTQTKARHESELKVMELKTELSHSTSQLEKTKETEVTLRAQLSFTQQVGVIDKANLNNPNIDYAISNISVSNVKA